MKSHKRSGKLGGGGGGFPDLYLFLETGFMNSHPSVHSSIRLSLIHLTVYFVNF